MPERITVIIPCRTSDVPTETMESLFAQTYKHLDFITVIDTDAKGQSWARNRGLSIAKFASVVLFSDYDCRWVPDAVECLYTTLHEAQAAEASEWPVGYAYGGYHQMQHGVPALTFGLQPWSWPRLCQSNYISTMSLVDTKRMAEKGCLQFDERLQRLEDWDLWLRCGQRGLAGIGVGKILFETDVKPGVSYGGVSHEEAELQVRRLRGLAAYGGVHGGFNSYGRV